MQLLCHIHRYIIRLLNLKCAFKIIVFFFILKVRREDEAREG